MDSSTIRYRTVPLWNATDWKVLENAVQVEYALWPEHLLREKGAAVATYEQVDMLSERWGPNWYTYLITGEGR